jgi:hypothetical protein
VPSQTSPDLHHSSSDLLKRCVVSASAKSFGNNQMGVRQPTYPTTSNVGSAQARRSRAILTAISKWRKAAINCIRSDRHTCGVGRRTPHASSTTEAALLLQRLQWFHTRESTGDFTGATVAQTVNRSGLRVILGGHHVELPWFMPLAAPMTRRSPFDTVHSRTLKTIKAEVTKYLVDTYDGFGLVYPAANVVESNRFEQRACFLTRHARLSACLASMLCIMSYDVLTIQLSPPSW